MTFYSEKRTSVKKVFKKPSRTKQAFAKESNVNFIMAKYLSSGVIEHVRKNSGFYADVTDVPDYKEALMVVMEASDLFNSLPSDIRTKFDNDPQKYLEFVSKPENKDQLIKWGMVKAPIEPAAPIEVRVVNPTPEATN